MYILQLIIIALCKYTYIAVDYGTEILDSSNHSSNHTAEDNGNDQGKLVMGSFLNKQGIRIRTYASRVKDPKGHTILVHGIRGHFRSDFCRYNVEWYTDNVGEYPILDAKTLFDKELEDVFPDLESLKKDGTVNEDRLHGINAFDVTPRFLYEGSFVHALNRLGLSVYGMDLQSHGLSGSRYKHRSYVDKFDDFVYDVMQFVSIIKRGKFDDSSEVWDEQNVYSNDRHDNLPYYLIGLSLGGNVVLKAQVFFSLNTKGHSKFVDGILALSPVLSFSNRSPTTSMILYSFSIIFTCLKQSKGFLLGNTKSYDGGVVSCMRFNDPLYYSNSLSKRLVLCLYNSVRTLRNRMNHFPKNLPTLFIHSKDDPMCSIEGPKYYMDTYFKDSEIVKLHELDGKTHVITKPSHVQTITPVLKEWFDTL